MTEVRAEITASVWQVSESPVAGTITKINVAPNDQVQEGDLIAIIE